MSEVYEPEVGDVVRWAKKSGLWRISRIANVDNTVAVKRADSRHREFDAAETKDIQPTVTTLAERKLGEQQKGLLDAMRTIGPWPNHGHTGWGSPSNTVRILEALEKKGLVKSQLEDVRIGWGPQARKERIWRATTPDVWDVPVKLAVVTYDVRTWCMENGKQVGVVNFTGLTEDQMNRLTYLCRYDRTTFAEVTARYKNGVKR